MLDAPVYERHRPEQTLLYQLVELHYPAFVTQLALEGKVLPDYVHKEFEAYLKCGRQEHEFLHVQCASCHAEQLVAYSIKRRGFLSGPPGLCWWTKYCLTGQCASGCSACLTRCGICLPANRYLP